MIEHAGGLNATSDIQYQDYLLLTLMMDSEWTQCSSEEDHFPPLANHELFRQNCLDFGQGINDNYDLWREANALEDAEAPSPADTEEPCYVDRYLYNSMSYFPLGHADDACVVLLDDHDPLHYLTLRVTRRIEDVSIAYALDMEHLVKNTGISFEEGEVDLSVFVSPHEQFDERHGPHNKSCPEGQRIIGKAVGLVTHAKQEDLPFLIYAKCRMGGFANLGCFLMAQQAIFKAMAKSVHGTLNHLDKLSQTLEKSDVLTSEDVKKTRCSFLDLKEVEEIGLFIFCNNMTIAAAIMSDLRKLRYCDAFEAQGDFQEMLEQDDVLRLVAEKSNGRPVTGTEAVGSILGNHVFRWTTSSVMVSPAVFVDEKYQTCRGALDARISCQLSPGHREYANDILTRHTVGDAVDASKFDLFTMGESDIVSPFRSVGNAGEDQSASSCITAASMIKGVRGAMEEFAKKPDNSPLTRRDCIELEVLLNVPIPPPNGSKAEDFRHNILLVNVIRKVHQELCPPLPGNPAFPGISETEPIRPLGMRELCHFRRRAGLPVHLGRTIESLYQMFFTILADPDRFDLVLDLYDVFASLHNLITNVLPKSYRDPNGPPGKGDATLVLDEHCVLQLAELVDAMENALKHRVAKVYSTGSPQDMDVYIRGGLNQVILAAAAPMMCSLGIFRRCVIDVPPHDKRRKSREDREDKYVCNSRSRTGVVGELSLLPGMRCRPLRIGHGGVNESQLAFYQIDVPHVLHPASYADYFHETGHLIFHSLFQKDSPHGYENGDLGSLWSLEMSQNRKKRDKFHIIETRLNEIFAMFFGHVFVYGTDRDGALVHYISTFARSLASIGLGGDVATRDTEEIGRLVEVVFRISMMYLLLPENGADESIEEWLEKELTIPDFKDAEQAFLQTLDMAERYTPDYQRLWRGKVAADARKHARQTFKAGFNTLRKYLPWVHKTVRKIYEKYVKIAKMPDDCNITTKWLQDQIDESFKLGRPILRCRLKTSEVDDNPELGNEAREPFLDTTYVVSRMLQQYIHNIKTSFNTRVVLHRDPKSGVISYPRKIGEDPWWEYQSDLGTTPLFCPVPASRRMRTLKQIVIKKTFRDIASTLHSRRFYRLVRDTLKADKTS